MSSAAAAASLAKSGVASAASGIVRRTKTRSLDRLARGVRTSKALTQPSPFFQSKASSQQHSTRAGPHRSRSIVSPPSSYCATSSRGAARGLSGSTGSDRGHGSSSSGGEFLAAGGGLSYAVSAVAAGVLVTNSTATPGGYSGENNSDRSGDKIGGWVAGTSTAWCRGRAAAGHAPPESPTSSASPSAAADAPCVSSDLSLNTQRCSTRVDDSDPTHDYSNRNSNRYGSCRSGSRDGRNDNGSEQRHPADVGALKELEEMRGDSSSSAVTALANPAAEAVGGTTRITDVYRFDGDTEQVVGRGSRSVVSSARHRLTGQRVAVKKLSRAETTRVEVMEEVSMLELAGRHPNVVTLQAFFEDQDFYYIVMDLCQGGELYHRLANKGRYSEGQAARIMAEVAEAVGFLHRHGIIHFDLKPENIMLAVGDDCVPEVRLADFGSAFRQYRELLSARDCTLAYSAPEVLARNSMVDEKVDMWALGVVMWVLLTGRHPFDAHVDLPIEEITRRVTEEEPDLRCRGIRHVSPEGKDLVRRLLAKDPEDRPSAYQMLSHPWLRAVMARAKVSNHANNLQEYGKRSQQNRSPTTAH